MRILCITPNVSMDRILAVPGFAVGNVWRAQRVDAVCGGKGVNVARTVRRLGHHAVCAGLIAGDTGRAAAARAAAEGLETRWTVAHGETRTCMVIVDENGLSTVVNEPGLTVNGEAWNRLVADVAEAAAEMDAVTVSGRFPPGVTAAGVADLVAAARRSGSPVWIDTHGAPLAAAVAARPDGIKINAAETGALLGRAVASPADAVTAAREIRATCGADVVVTLGAAGAVRADRSGVVRAAAPAVSIRNATGAGDAFLAGLVLADGAGETAARALAAAVAAGSADAMQPLPGALDPRDVARLRRSVAAGPV